MDSTPDARLKQRARRAYELRRARVGMTWAAAAIAASLTGAAVTKALLWSVGLGLLAGAASVGFVWHGRTLGRGVVPGLAIGAVAMLIALGGQVCSAELGGGLVACALPCALGGLGIGLVGARSGHGPRGPERLAAWAAVAAIAIPLALVGCVGLGVGGALGLGLGLVIGSVPVLIRATSPA